ncbi:MAG TPA: glycosyltransferase family 4 protein [Candidatus Sabulitectum sp.]|nr:glycosyltransferase family 4 protein [Candidatus Sabulitectum sp.]
MLPSGGGIRVLGQLLYGLASRFHLHVHQPEGACSASLPADVRKTVHPYRLWKRPGGPLRPAAPLFLILRLLSFKKVCRKAADEINSTADKALVHNCMPVAAAPILQYLTIPSVYFCYEYPRHIYEKDIIKRTNTALAEAALTPLLLLEKRIDRRSTAAATRIVTFSRYMQSRIESIYGRESSIVRPGVDSTFFHPEAKATADRLYILSVGALWPFKGHDAVIEMVSRLDSAVRPEIVIVSDREYPGYGLKLRSRAESLSVKLTIRKGITDIELRTLYQEALAVVCCQRREPYGLVPLEAMACGTPVVAIDEGGFTDNIIDGETGFLFSGSPEEGASLLMKLYEEEADTRKMGFAGRSFVARERVISNGAAELAEILESL